MTLTAVPPGADEPRFYPEIVAAFEALGFARLGGVHLVFADDTELDELVRSHPPEVQDEFRLSAETPETVLAAPDGTAFVGVDWFYRQPSIRLRSLLADGRLVETQLGWEHLPVPVVEMAPYVRYLRLRPEQDRSARGRHFAIVPGAGPEALWEAHRAALARAGVTPVVHASLEHAVALWQQVLHHDQAIEYNVLPAFERVVKLALAVPMTVTFLLAAIGTVTAFASGDFHDATPWWAVGASVAFASALGALLMAKRLTWWLRYRTSIRPRFAGWPIG